MPPRMKSISHSDDDELIKGEKNLKFKNMPNELRRRDEKKIFQKAMNQL